MRPLEGQRVLITGAGGGIGRAMVEAFATAGAQVIACDRTAEILTGVTAAGREAFDLTDPAACRAALDHHTFDSRPSLDDLWTVDAWARQEVGRWRS